MIVLAETKVFLSADGIHISDLRDKLVKICAEDALCNIGTIAFQLIPETFREASKFSPRMDNSVLQLSGEPFVSVEVNGKRWKFELSVNPPFMLEAKVVSRTNYR